MSTERTTLVLADVSDADGTMWRAVHLDVGDEFRRRDFLEPDRGLSV